MREVWSRIWSGYWSVIVRGRRTRYMYGSGRKKTSSLGEAVVSSSSRCSKRCWGRDQQCFVVRAVPWSCVNVSVCVVSACPWRHAEKADSAALRSSFPLSLSETLT